MLDRKKASNQPPVFAWPRLSRTDLLFIRIGGNGLGNLLFNWARALTASKDRGWRLIWPTWKSFKPKNWRVNPYDYRLYSGLFRPTSRYVSGWRKPWSIARLRIVPEAEALENGAPPGSVVMFQGMEDKFAPFLKEREPVLAELLSIARDRHLAGWRAADPAPIAIHVRRGDFVRRASDAEMIARDNSLLPLAWYIEALNAVRAASGRNERVWVFSDGTNQELARLLALPGVERREYGSSLADMLALARSRLLIASGSTFSMWGSYLGQVPTIWHQGKLLQHVLIEHPEREIEWVPGDSLPGWIGELWD